MGLDVKGHYLYGYDITDEVDLLDLESSEDFESLAWDRRTRIPDAVGITSTDVHGFNHRHYVHIKDLAMAVDWERGPYDSQHADGRENGQLVEYMKALNDALEALGIERRDSVIPSRIIALKVY